MFEIPFTQYLMPDGRKKATSIVVDDAVGEQAKGLIAAGYIFESEVLSTDEVSLTCTHNDSEDGDPLTIEVIPNGPEVLEAAKRLVVDAVALVSTPQEGENDGN